MWALAELSTMLVGESDSKVSKMGRIIEKLNEAIFTLNEVCGCHCPSGLELVV